MQDSNVPTGDHGNQTNMQRKKTPPVRATTPQITRYISKTHAPQPATIRKEAAEQVFATLFHHYGACMNTVGILANIIHPKSSESQEVKDRINLVLEKLMPISNFHIRYREVVLSDAVYQDVSSPDLKGKNEGEMAKEFIMALAEKAVPVLQDAKVQLSSIRGTDDTNKKLDTVVSECETAIKFLEDAKKANLGPKLLTYDYIPGQRMAFFGNRADLAAEVLAAYKHNLNNALTPINAAAYGLEQSAKDPALSECGRHIQTHAQAISSLLTKHSENLEGGNSSKFRLAGDSDQVLQSVVEKLGREISPHLKAIASELVGIWRGVKGLGSKLDNDDSKLAFNAFILMNKGVIRVNDFLVAARNTDKFDREPLDKTRNQYMAKITLDSMAHIADGSLAGTGLADL